MRAIKSIFRKIFGIFRSIYHIIDKKIIMPITKLILLISDKAGKHTGKFEKWLTKKNTLIFISLILAIGLFFYVDNESTAMIDSRAEILYDQKVEVIYNEEAYVIEGLPETVDVTLIGRQVDLYLAKQLSTGVVTADLSNFTEGTHKISLEYKSPINSVSYKLDPSAVNITVYSKVSKTQDLTAEIINEDKLDSKLSIASVTLDTEEIVIKGAEHTLNEVASVKALVDVSKITDQKTGVNTLDDIKLVAYDSDGNVVEVETVPSKVTASISIESPSKELAVKVVPTGSVEFGKALDSITSSVTKVTVYGSQDVLDKLEYIPVEVDVTGLASDKNYTAVTISKPSGIKAISETSTNISVKLGTEVSKEITDVLIETENLDSNYKVLAIGESSSKTTVIVKGTQNVLESIDSSMVKATVDLSGYTEGDYEIEVKVSGEDEKATYASKTTKIKVRIQAK